MQVETVEHRYLSCYNSSMKQARLPTIPAADIYKALIHTPAGKSLRASLRYSPFRHNEEDKGHWRKMLGPSAITYSHMKHVYKLTKRALLHEQKISHKLFSRMEQETLLLAALCHDFGEAILDDKSVGDVPAPKKRALDEKIEQRVFKQVLKSLNLNSKLKSKMWMSYREVCHNKKSRLYKFFHFIEHIDYMDTGLTTYKNLASGKNKLKRGKHLIGQILAFSIPVLANSDHNHNSTHHFLRTREEKISEMFKYCIVEYRKAEKLKRVILGIDVAVVTWQNYLKS